MQSIDTALSGKRHWLLISAGLLAGCATQPVVTAHVADPAPAAMVASPLPVIPEVMPGYLQGFIPPEKLPDSLALLPPPPASGSAAFAADEHAFKSTRKLAGTPRWELAIQDADLHFPTAAGTFSCALGIAINEEDMPQLYQLLRRSTTDAGLATYAAKNHYQRKRPFALNNTATCTPTDDAALSKDGSYPSGHTSIGWAWALILTEIAPERQNALLQRGYAFGESRVVCGAHWQSDVDTGRVIASSTVARLRAEPAFQKQLAIARAEVAAARSKGLAPTRDCAAESEALSR